jgi:hypothetical protein
MTAYVVAAYVITVVLIGGYGLTVALRTRVTERALAAEEPELDG